MLRPYDVTAAVGLVRKVMRNQRILLVEDHPDDAFLTVYSLRKKDFRNVVVVDEAMKALEYLFSPEETGSGEEKEMPSLIIVDLKLPKMDGFDLIRAIKCNEVTRGIPLAVLSSSFFAREKERCQELGVGAYFSKPLDVDEFEAFVSLCAVGNGTGGAYVNS